MQRNAISLVLGALVIAVIATGCAQLSEEDRLAAEIAILTGEFPEALVAVSIRDPANDFRLDQNSGSVLHAASTMKVPVMIEIFRRAARGDFSLEDSLAVVNDFKSIVDGSPYAIGDDPDDTVYETPGTNMTIRALMENMIRVSSNLATNILIEFVDPDSVQATTERLGTIRMQTLRGVEDIKAYDAGLSNRTTSGDLAVLMEHIMLGQAVGEEEDAEMRAVLLGQQITNMIPARLPVDVRVAHKTGSITRIHHDAAIVMPKDADPYVLVVLIEGMDDWAESGDLGARIAELVHRRLRP